MQGPCLPSFSFSFLQEGAAILGQKLKSMYGVWQSKKIGGAWASATMQLLLYVKRIQPHDDHEFSVTRS